MSKKPEVTQEFLNTLKPKATDAHRVVLAYGEVTGHAHAFYEKDKVELLESTDVKETRTFLNIKQEASLQHEEHATHVISPGIGEVITQREYQMGQLRRTMD